MKNIVAIVVESSNRRRVANGIVVVNSIRTLSTMIHAYAQFQRDVYASEIPENFRILLFLLNIKFRLLHLKVILFFLDGIVGCVIAIAITTIR